MRFVSPIRAVILNHEGDLLTRAAAAPSDRFLPAREVVLLPDRTEPDYPTGGFGLRRSASRWSRGSLACRCRQLTRHR